MRCSRDTKILRPEQCVVWDGEPCFACAEDIELKLAIKELEDQIERMYIKRRALRTIMNENHDQLISKFPPEIASEIFIYYAPPHKSFVKDKKYRSTPLYLGAVCRKWRQLAWRTPQLWPDIMVEFDPMEKYSTHLLAERLERSANLPLTISLSPFSHWKRAIDDGIYLEVINILNRHSSHWHTLRIGLPAHQLHRLCGSLGGSMLYQLILQPMNESTEHSDAYDVATFSMKCKPTPTRLKLAKYRLRNVDIVWNCLTHVALESIAVDECLELMRRAPLLEALALLQIIRSSGAFPAPATRIILPQLHRLAINHIADNSAVAEALDSMCAPSLKHWNHWPSRDHSSVNNMISFIEHSSFSLKNFDLMGSKDIYYQVHRILHCLSSLEFLTLRFLLRDQSPNDELLNRLCTSDESSPFLPCLRSLELCPQSMFPWESLPRIFSSPTRQSLRVKVNLATDVRIPDEAAEKLLGLVHAGFNLSILRDGKVDVLAEYRKKRRLSQTTYQ